MKSLTDSDIEALDDEIGILLLISGTLKDGGEHYAYASIPLSKYEPFKKAEATGNYNLADYGKILTHGEGKEPSEEVKQRIEDEYGANHHFERDAELLMARMREGMIKQTD